MGLGFRMSGSFYSLVEGSGLRVKGLGLRV